MLSELSPSTPTPSPNPDMPSTVEGFEAETLALGQRMLRVADHYQRVFAQRADFQFAVASRISHESYIHHVAQHVLVHLVGAAVLHVDADGRIAFQEFLQVPRQRAAARTAK